MRIDALLYAGNHLKFGPITLPQSDLPCDAFKKNADGSWTQVATLIAGGALIPAGSNFKNTAETRIIEKKCDKK